MQVQDAYWAERIASGDGNFILWFRHAERAKWVGTVTVFDYFEIEENLEARSESWADAVCLSKKGIEEAKVLGVTFRKLGIKPHRVLSSPACRARETAELAFGGADRVSLGVLHTTAVSPSQQQDFANLLSAFLDEEARDQAAIELPASPTVVTGHGNTLHNNLDLFSEVNLSNWEISELGFIVIEVVDGELIAQHAFIEFSDFANKVLIYSQLN
jgi:phosphohistidine phosphatase SixA